MVFLNAPCPNPDDSQMTAPPGDRGQLDFLQHVQRIFDEGEFVATYKFALLIA